MTPDDRLLEEVVWRLEVLTPLHAGSGEHLTKGLDVESEEGWTYVVDVDALVATLPPGKHALVGVEELRRLCAGLSLRNVQRYAVRGNVRGASFPERGAAALRCFARDGFGRPYLPGSTLKGALRTAILAAIAEKEEPVRRALGDAARRRSGRGADERVQEVAFRTGERRIVDDVLRHLHVPDVPVPPAAVEVVEVKIESMKEGGGWNQKGWSTFVEAVQARTVIRVPLRIDERALRKNDRQDFSRWRAYLAGGGLFEAARAHGERILGPEVTLWTRSRQIDAAAEAAAGLAARAKSGDAVFPVAWGIGWRGMTGATLERLDGPGPRASDANAEDPATLRAARASHSTMAGRPVPVFPKSRRLAVVGRDPALPMGWVAVRAWKEDDTATPFDPVAPPPGTLGGQAPRRQDAASPRRPAPAPAATAAPAKRGDPVRGTLTGKSKKGKWKVTLLQPSATGTVVDGDAPDGAAEGMLVDLVVKTAPVGPGQDWDLAWPPRKG